MEQYGNIVLTPLGLNIIKLLRKSRFIGAILAALGVLTASDITSYGADKVPKKEIEKIEHG